MTKFTTKTSNFIDEWQTYAEVECHMFSPSVTAWDVYDEDEDGNEITAELNEDAFVESFNKQLEDWLKKNLNDVSITFPAVRYENEDTDEEKEIEYDAVVPLSECSFNVSSGDDGHYGGFNASITIELPDNNKHIDGSCSLTPVVLLAAWKLEEILNVDEEFAEQIFSNAWEDSIDYVTKEKEVA